MKWSGINNASCVRGGGVLYGLAVALGLTTGPSQADPGSSLRCAMPSDDGRTLSISAPGITAFDAGFAATVQVGDRTCVLSSAGGKASAAAESSTESTPCGPADWTVRTICFEEDRIDLLFRVGPAPGMTGVVVQAGIRNTGSAPVRLVSLTPLAGSFRVSDDSAEWLITRLDESVKKAPPVIPLDQLQKTQSVHECGGFYRKDGSGFLFGPVGAPIAYLNASFARDADGSVSMRLVADMSGVRTDPGETRWGQQAALLMEAPGKALPYLAEWVAKTHGARTDKGALSGWSSWYFLGEKVTGADVLASVDAVSRSSQRLRPGVIQIDNGYQSHRGSTDAGKSFSEGLSFYAKRIAATGARPGLFVEHRGAVTQDGTTSNTVRNIQQAVRDGFTFLKIRGEQSGEAYRSERHTGFEADREDYLAFRQAAGENVFLLFSDYVPSRAVVGAVDASRTGFNALRTTVSAAMLDVLRSYHLQGRWFAVDNDAYYMGTDIANASEINGGWPLVRTWMSMVGLSCGMAMTSDPWSLDAFKPYWRNVEVLTPPARERSEVLDLCTGRNWPRLVGHVNRDWGNSTVALLWNPTGRERAITLDFDRAGMDTRMPHAVWSFWDRRYLGVAEKSWTTPPLGPVASQHLCFTPLDRSSSRPVLIGSDLHIYCGAAEIQRIVVSRVDMEIDLTDAGARDGNLFVYSRYPMTLKGATGCIVTGIEGAGENVWRINLSDRRHEAPQRVSLGLLLPVTRQVWFWSLVAFATASLAFGVRWYEAGLRLRRRHALDQVRSRIAQDLHDNLGADLTQIGLLSELARRKLDQPEQAERQLDRIFASAHEITRQLDATVWAVNPANDTLESLVQYLGKYAEEFLSLANLRCRLAVPADTSGMALSSAMRHNLFLAVKEALHNVVRHAGATLVVLRILLEAGLLIVEIEDDGKGMPAGDALPGQDGMGNIQRRMTQLGGQVECLPGDGGRGTRVRLVVPLQGRKQP